MRDLTLKKILSLAVLRTLRFMSLASDMIIYNGKIARYDGNTFTAFSVTNGRFYNLETRWEGFDFLAAGLDLIKLNAKVTPEGQWVRIIGGFSLNQN